MRLRHPSRWKPLSMAADSLRMVVCSGSQLASQPTISRLENAAASTRACYRIALALFGLYIRQRGKDGTLKKVLLDFDATDDPTHGEQEGSFYHGNYEEHIYHPLVVFDGETNQLITAVLRAGNTHAGRGTLSVLKRIVGRIRKEWPAVEIELRADAGFADPEIYDYCESERIGYAIGLIRNPRLEGLAAPLLDEVQERYEVEVGCTHSTGQARKSTSLKIGCRVTSTWRRRDCPVQGETTPGSSSSSVAGR